MEIDKHIKEKKYQERPMRSKNYNWYFTIINGIKTGNKIPNTSLSKQALNYYINVLKKEDIIRKLGYGTWELTGKKFKPKEVKRIPVIMSNPSKDLYKNHPSLPVEKNIRGHGFIVTFKIPKFAGWYKREEFFKKKNLNPKRIGIRDSGLSILFRGYTVHIYKTSIVIYSPQNRSYFSSSAEKAFQYGLYDIIEIFKGLEALMGISLKFGKSYKFKVSRQHYAKVNDSLAKIYKEKGRRLELQAGSGETWLISDNSLNIDELETVNKETAKDDMDSIVKPFFNDLKDHYDKTGEALRLTDFLIIHAMMAENVKTHFKVLNDINEAIKEFSSKVNNLPYRK